MGATAVLLYAVPHGLLSQPSPLIGGHSISAAIGVCCARYVGNDAIATALATALAVGVAIGVMYQFKCIHPPGGATAFTAVMGGPAVHEPAVHELGFHFVLDVSEDDLLYLARAIAVRVGDEAPEIKSSAAVRTRDSSDHRNEPTRDVAESTRTL